MANGKAKLVDEETPTTEVIKFIKPIPIGKIIELRNKHLTYDEIGKLLGCSRENICQRLRPVIHEIEAADTFKTHRADILAVHQSRILNRLTNEDIEKATGYQKVGMFSLLYDKERLERGETTQNIGYADYSKTLQAVMREREKLVSELGLDESESFIDVNTPIAEDE